MKRKEVTGRGWRASFVTGHGWVVEAFDANGVMIVVDLVGSVTAARKSGRAAAKERAA